MSRKQTVLRPSILDRLQSGSRAASYGSVSDYRRAVLRDVEWLLNHRRTIDPAPDSCPETQRSVYHYGIPDLTAISPESGQGRGRVRRMIEEAIRIFEPRLQSVRVSVSEESGGQGVRFVIEGLLRMDPEPELLRFDTVMETGTGGFKVTEHA